MRDAQELADRPADVAVSQPELLAEGYRDYWRYRVALRAPLAVPQLRRSAMSFSPAKLWLYCR